MSKIGLETRAREKRHVTQADIEAGIRQLGVRRGHNVGVHSSLGSFGYVEGGADAVIDALLAVIGPEGTAVFPTYSNNREWLQVTEEDLRVGVVKKRRYLPFDPKVESCWTGRIPETFRRRKDAVRGDHPTHSLAAMGPRAAELCQGWDKLLAADGHILLLGVTLSCCSSMHLAERRVAHLPQSPDPPAELKTLMDRHEAEGLRVNVRYPGMLCYPDFAQLEAPCREHGILRETRIGDAQVKLLRLQDLIDLYARYLEERPGLFYHT